MNADVKFIKPRRTSDSNKEEKLLSSTISGQSRAMSAGLNMGPNPTGTMTFTATKTNQQMAGSEKIQYNSRITSQYGNGNAWWGFNIDDDNFRNWGIDLQENDLPSVCFEFFGEDEDPAPPPECMDIVITSCWSIIPPSGPKSTWIRKLLHIFKSTGNTQTTSYSSLFQIVALKADLSNFTKPSHYKATVKVRSGASDSQVNPNDVKRKAGKSVGVKLAVVNGRFLTLLTCRLGESDKTNVFRSKEAKQF